MLLEVSLTLRRGSIPAAGELISTNMFIATPGRDSTPESAGIQCQVPGRVPSRGHETQAPVGLLQYPHGFVWGADRRVI